MIKIDLIDFYFYFDEIIKYLSGLNENIIIV